MSDAANIKRIGIAGSGRMGTDIFLFLDGHGFELRWLCKGETEQTAAEACFLKRIARQKKTGMLSDAAYELKLKSTLISCDAAIFSDCDLIIESIPEHRDEKKNLLAQIDKIVSAGCIITSNSSSIRPSILVPSANRKTTFAGMHFFYPLAFKTAAELIVTEHTSENTKIILRNFLTRIGRNIFELDEEHAFMLNRIFLPVQAEACRLVEEAIMEFREVDAIVKKFVFPCGIFSFFDQVGNDVMLSSVNNYAEFEAEPGFLIPMQNLLQRMVSDHLLGIKTGIGFYNYQNPDNTEVEINPADENVQICIGLLEASYKNAAMAMAQKTGTELLKLNEALMEYTGADKGPFSGNSE